MKYIKKETIPTFFIEETKELKEKIKRVDKNQKKLVWEDDYKNKIKLRKYILEHEQNNLCGYCEKIVDINNCHLEHLEPKSNDYDNLTFDYHNIIVSCNGICQSSNNPNKEQQTCGHKKGKKFDIELFLNPTKVYDIREYFIYTKNGNIGASNKSEIKSKYTLNILDLNSIKTGLPEDRTVALKNFKIKIMKISKETKKDISEIAKRLLNKENLAFISFLRFQYKNILTEKN